MQSLIPSFTRPRLFAIFGLIGLLALLISFPLGQPQAQTTPKPKVPAGAFKRFENYGFITVQTPTGSECRPISESEARAFPLSARGAELHDLSDTRLRSTRQGNLTIQLEGTPQLEMFPLAKAAFQRAAAKWQNVLRTPITIKLAVDFGTMRFGTPYPNANIIGSTDPIFLGFEELPTFPNPYFFMREALRDFTNNPQQATFMNALPTAGLPTDVGTTRNTGATLVNFRGLEIADDQDLLDFGPPSIGFNSAIPFDFDPSDGIDSDKIDFEATAVHEIGHALGFSSWTGFKELTINTPIFPAPWDFFRFRNGPLDFNSVAARPRAMMAGGAQSYFIGDEFALSTATPSGTNGDQRQASHWRDDLLSGQFIGIMDPSAANGDREEMTFNDLTTLSFMGYDINPDGRAFDFQSIADTSREESQDRANTTVVNRYQPSRYPSRLEGIRILMPQGTEAGLSVRLIAFVDASRTGQPPASPSLLINQTVTIPALPQTRYVEFRFATPLTINSGDVYVGMNVGASGVRFAADTTRAQGRSWLTTNDGANWSAFGSMGVVPMGANFMARAIFSSTYGTALAPQLTNLSPNIVAANTANVTLFANGRNFQRNSVIRFNGADRATTYLSNTRLSIALQASDVAAAGTAQVRVFTAGGTESGALPLTIGTDNPLPTITAIDPPAGQTGTSGVAINIYGTNFNAASRVRFNDQERVTTFRSSSQLEAAITAADLAGGGTATITVVNPTPGGGTSNAFGFNVSGCAFSFANAAGTGLAGLLLSSTATDSGFTLNVGNGTCGWTLSATEPWVTITSPTSGTGRSVINFSVGENTGATQRTAQIRINNQTFDVRQAARIANVSAASYVNDLKLAPGSIVAMFGLNLATITVSGTTIPLPTQLGNTEVVVVDNIDSLEVLPTTRRSALFFVSPGQINFQIPENTALGDAFIQVRINGTLFADQRVTIVSLAPGFFTTNATGQGVPAAQLLRIKPGGVLVYEDVAEFIGGTWVPRALDVGPDADQLFLVLFGTGIRGVSGVAQVQLKVGDQAAPALYAGPQGQLVGLDQINLNFTNVRANLRGRGEVNLTGTVGGIAINAVKVRFQ